MSACAASRWELTETYSPAAIESAPATSPAIPAVRIAAPEAPEAATPSTRLAVETMPSLAPSTAARSQFDRWLRCVSVARMAVVTLDPPTGNERDRRGHGERDREGEVAGVERGGGGDDGDEQRAAGVSEFASELGGTHRLSEPLTGGQCGQRGESERRDQAGSDADQAGRGQQAEHARQQGAGEARRAQREPGADAGARGEAARVERPARLWLGERGAGGEDRHGGAG